MIIGGVGEIQRVAAPFTNLKGDLLPGSFYPTPVENINERNTCIIYLHGNASNQMEGRFLIGLFPPVGISLFCFDFDGCGLSTGDMVSLGYYEQEDVKCAMDMLHEKFGVQDFILWGRSMGAAVTVMATGKFNADNRIKAILIDSPYASIRYIVKGLGKEKRIPRWIADRVYKKVRKNVRNEANFDLQEISPITDMTKITCPVFMIHAIDDHFVSVTNSRLLYASCPSMHKRLRIIKGEHNTPRPPEVLKEAVIFLCHAVNINIEFPEEEEEILTLESAPTTKDQHFKDLNKMIHAQNHHKYK